MKGLTIQDTQTNETSNLEVNGLFYAIGHVPNTEPFKGKLELDETGYIKVCLFFTLQLADFCPLIFDYNRPSCIKDIPLLIPRLKACLRVVMFKTRSTAAGSGCMAALDCERWLEAHETH